MTSKSSFGLFAVLALGSLVVIPAAFGDDWPQWRGPQRDGVWRETGIVAKLPEKLNFKWKTPVGAGYSGPAVVGNRVYVTDRILPADTANPANPFDKTAVNGSERILCLNADNGEIVWKHEYPCQYTISYPSGPRATPTIDNGKVYSLGAMGDFFCLDAATGKVNWSFNYVKEYETEMNAWGMSSAPLIHGEKLYLVVGGPANDLVVCLDKNTGKKIWGSQNSRDPGYAAPILIEDAGVKQLIVWSAASVVSLNPEDGKLNWQESFPLKFGMAIAGPIHDAKRHLVFVTAFYDGPLAIELDPEDREKSRIKWRGRSESEIKTDGLHAVMCTPLIIDDFIYGVCSYGQLRCLDLLEGHRVWETLKATGKGRWWNAFLIKNEDRVFICNEQGELIIAKLDPGGYEENSRTFLIEPTGKAERRKIVWSHPAFANKCIYARNDKEIVCADLSAK